MTVDLAKLRPLPPPEMPRFARASALALVLIATPWLLLTGGWIAERRTARAHVERLERVPFLIDPDVAATCMPVAARERVVIGRIDIRGATAMRTGSLPFDDAEAQLPPWSTRSEVRDALAGNRAFGRYQTPDGSGMLVTLAQPRPDGAVLYILAGFPRTLFARIPPIALLGYTLAILLVLRAVSRARRRDLRSETPP